MSDRPLRIAVVGEREASHETLQRAEEVGTEIGRRGGILICGGMGGVMEAASRGCARAGGVVAGVLPTSSSADANPHVGIPIVTGMGEGRNIIIVRSAHAVIAVGGSYGTLSEIAFALRLEIPVVGLDTWTVARPGQTADPIIRAQSPLEAVELAWAAAHAQARAGRPFRT